MKSKSHSRGQQTIAKSNQIYKIHGFVLGSEVEAKEKKKFDLYKVNYSLMINITTESNQSFTTEMEKSIAGFLSLPAINYSIQKK